MQIQIKLHLQSKIQKKSIKAQMMKGENCNEYFRALALAPILVVLRLLNKPPWPADSENGIGNQNWSSQLENHVEE